MRIVSAGIAVATGLLVLAGYFVPSLAGVQSLLLSWALILAGFAVLMGIFNLILVHWEKVHLREKGSSYSILLLLSLFVAFFLGLGNFLLRFWQVPPLPVDRLMVDGIITPAESALLAILTVTLLYTAMRLLRRRADWMSIVFLITVVFVLLTSTALPLIGGMNSWVTQVLALGGARGILTGVALGTLMTGLRVLFAIDRPYGGK